ncbi:ESPR-type extended signal peptide-containing protein, partial [Paraburkholderia piptadeniae]|uniref:ESPR-type extended signal peptide-containing protein n=1 Tax=Paraburkholderia piptadeniae TaxID=1701573 RepID=UPI0022A8AE6F
MNRVYRTVWNETTGTWAAAQENAAARGKGASKKSLAAVIGVVGAGMGLAASGAHAAVTAGYGSLELCPGLATGGTGYSYGYATSMNNLDCTVTGSNPLAFSLNNTGDTNGSYGFSASTARVTGYQTGLLELKGGAGISMLNTVDMNANKITDLAPGAVNVSSADAINGSQLYNVASSTAAALGGGSTFNTTTGTISAPTYVLDGGNTTATSVGGAITNLDGRVTQNTTDISNLATQINNGTIGLVQQASSTATVTVAKGTGGTLVDFTGTAGVRKLTGVANGNVNASSVDAVNGSQLYNLANSTANAIGGGSTVNNDGSISNPTYVVGGSTLTNVAGAITNIDARMNNIISGGGIKYFHTNSTLSDSTASGVDSVAIGGAAAATARNSVALGSGSTTTANLSAAGYNPGNTALLGTASAANGEMSVGSAGKERRLTNVAAGSAATDAVNVSQLQSEDAKVNTEGAATAAALGGGSTFNTTTGTISAPTYVLNDGNTTVTNVGSAITNLDGRVTQNTTDISNIETQINSGSIGLVQQDQSTRTITVAKGTDGTVVDFTGTAGARRLTGLLNGNMNASSTDAVNGAQLYNVSQSTANALGGGSTLDPTTGTISAPTYVLDSGNATVTNVGSAITNLDGRVTQNTTDISNIETQINSGSIGLVQQDQ